MARGTRWVQHFSGHDRGKGLAFPKGQSCFIMHQYMEGKLSNKPVRNGKQGWGLELRKEAWSGYVQNKFNHNSETSEKLNSITSINY